jgi:hypothetical protein
MLSNKHTLLRRFILYTLILLHMYIFGECFKADLKIY